MKKLVGTIAFTSVVIGVLGLLAASFLSRDIARLSDEAGTGPTPILPKPDPPVVPTINIAPARPWSGNEIPIAGEGLRVERFAVGLKHPRWLYVLPNGDVLVAETNSPPRHDDGGGLKGWIMGLVMARAGAGVPSPNRISILRDSNGDGVADICKVFLSGLDSPFGMALIGGDLFVANTDAVVRFPYSSGMTEISVEGVKVADLPAGPINHHWTKGLLASEDGERLYVSVGSNSNVAENGLDNEVGRAAIYEVNLASGRLRVFASGLRNPVGLAWRPRTQELWTVVNERDELGSDLVPDYLTSVKDGGFYGWPYLYYGSHIDPRISQPKERSVTSAIVPDYALGNHVAPLGIAFSEGETLPERYRDGVFVGEHGSWNRNPRSGYKVVFVSFAGGKPTNPPIDVLSGFIDSQGNAAGRPGGVAIDKTGALLVADDVGNIVWRVTSASKTSLNP